MYLGPVTSSDSKMIPVGVASYPSSWTTPYSVSGVVLDGVVSLVGFNIIPVGISSSVGNLSVPFLDRLPWVLLLYPFPGSESVGDSLLYLGPVASSDSKMIPIGVASFPSSRTTPKPVSRVVPVLGRVSAVRGFPDSASFLGVEV